MNAEFNWWLLIVGVAAGAGLAWLTISDWGRREEDVALDERAAEAAWIADVLRQRGAAVDPIEAEEILVLHRTYLEQAGLVDPDEPEPAGDSFTGSGDPVWGPNEWAREAWDEEAAARGSGLERRSSTPAVEPREAPPWPPASGGPPHDTGNVPATQTLLFDPANEGPDEPDPEWPPETPARPSIRAAGSVAPRAAPETRQTRSEPPEP